MVGDLGQNEWNTKKNSPGFVAEEVWESEGISVRHATKAPPENAEVRLVILSRGRILISVVGVVVTFRRPASQHIVQVKLFHPFIIFRLFTCICLQSATSCQGRLEKLHATISAGVHLDPLLYTQTPLGTVWKVSCFRDVNRLIQLGHRKGRLSPRAQFA